VIVYKALEQDLLQVSGVEHEANGGHLPTLTYFFKISFSEKKNM
jgi:hypothetical protein